MPAVRSLLELLLRTKKEGKAVKELSGELKGLKQAAGEAEESASKLNLGLMAVQGAVISAGVAFLTSIPDIVEHGIEINRAETALRAYAGSAEEAALAVELMKEATGGSISRLDAMQSATRMLSMGLADNVEDVAKLTEVAITLGATMGKGPQQALEEFTLMLANQSILRLDTFGISGANVRDRMQELADEGIAPADRQMRFLIATMEEAEGKMLALEAAGFEAHSNLDRLKTTIVDLKDSAAIWLADGLMPWIDGMYALRDATREAEERAILAADTFEGYLKQKMAGVGGAAIMSGDQLAQLKKRFDEVQLSAHSASESIELWRVGAFEAKEASQGLAEANRQIALSLSEVTQASLAKEAMDKLNQVWDEGIISQEQYENMFVDIASGLGGLESDSIDAQLKLFDLNQEFDAGAIEAHDYIDEVQNLATELGLLPDEITVRINLVTTGSVPYVEHEGARQFGGPVKANRSYWVGETGPELFITNQSGTIIPSGQVAPGGGGGLNILGDINISGASGDPSAMVDEFLAELGRRQQQANASGMGYIGA